MVCNTVVDDFFFVAAGAHADCERVRLYAHA